MNVSRVDLGRRHGGHRPCQRPPGDLAVEPFALGPRDGLRIGQPRDVTLGVENDRTGHDRRYCLDTTKLRATGWAPQVPFAEGLQQTVEWYRDNEWWWRPIKEQDAAYKAYIQTQYGARR